VFSCEIKKTKIVILS